ncbi:MAG: glyoxalase superfamily protein [Fimbriimonadaceae bacterium]|nr:VOC family protein [Chthonomonadaceae bacterium]MCO5296600.1 glyoxalase superfamily protein [Fimbriimonadaceae bacterium]
MADETILRTVTVMPVTDVVEAAGWYKSALGFELRWLKEGGELPPNYAVLERDGVQVHLILDEDPRPQPEWLRAGRGYLYLQVRDVESLYSGARSSGVVRGIETEPWGARAFLLEDPSGNSVRVEEPAQ